MTPTPRAGDFGVKGIKFMYIIKHPLLYTGAWFRQTKCIVIMTRKGSTEIVNLMNPRSVVLVLRRDHIYMSYSENALFL